LEFLQFALSEFAASCQIIAAFLLLAILPLFLTHNTAATHYFTNHCV